MTLILERPEYLNDLNTEMILILKRSLVLTPNLSYGLLASSTQRQYSDKSHISYMLCDIYLTYVSKSFWINSFF